MPKIPNEELLIRIDERVSEILRRLDNSDHNYATLDRRVNDLEGWRWWTIGTAAGISFVIAFVKDNLFK